MKANKPRTRKCRNSPAFGPLAERTLRRAAYNLKIKNRALGLPVIVWQYGKKVKEPA